MNTVDRQLPKKVPIVKPRRWCQFTALCQSRARSWDFFWGTACRRW